MHAAFDEFSVPVVLMSLTEILTFVQIFEYLMQNRANLVVVDLKQTFI